MVNTFPEGICSKVNVIGLLEFKLAYRHVAVQHVSPDDPSPVDKLWGIRSAEWKMATSDGITPSYPCLFENQSRSLAN